MTHPPRSTAPTPAQTLARRTLALASLAILSACTQTYLAMHEPSWMVSSAGRPVDVAVGRIRDRRSAYADSVCSTIYYRAMSPVRDSTADVNNCRKYDPKRTDIWRGSKY